MRTRHAPYARPPRYRWDTYPPPEDSSDAYRRALLVRKRACGLVQIIGQRIRALGRDTTIERMHAHLPRVLKTAAS
jgi:hypothetical protein